VSVQCTSLRSILSRRNKEAMCSCDGRKSMINLEALIASKIPKRITVMRKLQTRSAGE
jgi:hypothetical protein